MFNYLHVSFVCVSLSLFFVQTLDQKKYLPRDLFHDDIS